MAGGKIAIVGAHSGSKLMAPYGDPGWTIWTCSFRNESELPRHNAWFELHSLDTIKGCGPAYWDWLSVLSCIFMRAEVCGYFPGAVPFPRDEMLARFGRNFFRGTLHWMLAKAITRAPEEIGLWGIAADAAEYPGQIEGIRHYATVADGLGIRMTAPANPRLLEPPPLYPNWE